MSTTNDIWHQRKRDNNHKHFTQRWCLGQIKDILKEKEPAAVIRLIFANSKIKKQFSCAASFLEHVPYELHNLRRYMVTSDAQLDSHNKVYNIRVTECATINLLSDFYCSYKQYIKFIFEAFGVKCTFTQCYNNYQRHIDFSIPADFFIAMKEETRLGLLDEKSKTSTTTASPAMELLSELQTKTEWPTSTRNKVEQLISEVPVASTKTVQTISAELNELKSKMEVLTKELEQKKKHELLVLTDEFLDKITWISDFKKKEMQSFLVKNLL